MTIQQEAYARYMMARQSAMRAFVAQAVAAGGESKPEEPVPPPPPPPPVTTRHVSLSAVEENTNNPLGATVLIQEYSGHDPEILVREVQAEQNVSADIQLENWIRIKMGNFYDDRGFLKFSYVNGERIDHQHEQETESVFADVALDSDDTKILAEYHQSPI